MIGAKNAEKEGIARLFEGLYNPSLGTGPSLEPEGPVIFLLKAYVKLP